MRGRYTVLTCGLFWGAASILLTPPARGDEIAQGVCGGTDRGCRAIVANTLPAGASVPARLTIGRDLDLSGQAPVHFVPATASGGAGGYVLSNRADVGDAVHAIGALPPVRLATIGSTPAGLPVRTRGLTSTFGMRQHPLLGGTRFHAGIDLAARAGDGVFATGAGRVIAAGWSGGYGLAVTIDHGNGLETRYAHLSRLGVVAGEEVKAGEMVGLVGSTGLSTGPHLHYEMRRFGRPVDPVGTLRR